jgi:multiple sugar transport system permease protein
MSVAPLAVTSGRKRAASRLARREALTFYLCVSPWIIGFLLFTLGPMVAAFLMSFTNYSFVAPPRWIGLANYAYMFQNDPLFGPALYNTFYYAALAVPTSLTLGLAIALLLNQAVRGLRLFRTIFYLPVTVPAVASALVFSLLFAPTTGQINQTLHLVGVTGPQWLLDPTWFKPALVVVNLWTAGGGMLLYLAGLQGIDRSLYEAASLDGAGSWQRLRYITLPMLSPVIFFNLVTGIIGAMQLFTSVYVLGGSGGGPGNAGLTLLMYLYQQGFADFHMGYAAALSWVLFVIIAALTVIVVRWSAAWVHYETEIRR